MSRLILFIASVRLVRTTDILESLKLQQLTYLTTDVGITSPWEICIRQLLYSDVQLEPVTFRMVSMVIQISVDLLTKHRHFSPAV